MIPQLNPVSDALSDIEKTGSWGGAVVRALASHQCVPGSIPGPDIMCGLSLLLVLALAPRVFLRVLRFSSLLKKSTFLNCNSIGNSRATGLSAKDCYVLPSFNQSQFIFIFIKNFVCPTHEKLRYMYTAT